MKNLFTLCLLLGALSLLGQTTMEEYNYLTKGYKIQVESGLDMKKGYRIDDKPTRGEGTIDMFREDRSSKHLHLYREGEEFPCATLIIYTRRSTGWSTYFCLPHYNSSFDVLQKAYAAYGNLPWIDSHSKGYTWQSMMLLSYATSYGKMSPPDPPTIDLGDGGR